MDEIIQQNQPDKLEDTVKEITENFVKALFGAMKEPTAQTTSPSPDFPTKADVVESEDDSEKWKNLAEQAIESVVNSPAYLVIALEHLDMPGAPTLVIPRVFHAAKEPEHALILQSQLAHLLASMQDTTLAGVIEQQKDQESA